MSWALGILPRVPAKSVFLKVTSGSLWFLRITQGAEYSHDLTPKC